MHEQAAKKLSFVGDSRYTLDCGEAAAEELAERGLRDGVVGSEELTLLPAVVVHHLARAAARASARRREP